MKKIYWQPCYCLYSLWHKKPTIINGTKEVSRDGLRLDQGSWKEIQAKAKS
jgi:hypothetical protein